MGAEQRSADLSLISAQDEPQAKQEEIATDDAKPICNIARLRGLRQSQQGRYLHDGAGRLNWPRDGGLRARQAQNRERKVASVFTPLVNKAYQGVKQLPISFHEADHAQEASQP